MFHVAVANYLTKTFKEGRISFGSCFKGLPWCREGMVIEASRSMVADSNGGWLHCSSDKQRAQVGGVSVSQSFCSLPKTEPPCRDQVSKQMRQVLGYEVWRDFHSEARASSKYK